MLSGQDCQQQQQHQPRRGLTKINHHEKTLSSPPSKLSVGLQNINANKISEIISYQKF
jgi:hypothetical protein